MLQASEREREGGGERETERKRQNILLISSRLWVSKVGMKNQKKINTKQFLYLTGWHHHTRYSRCKTYPAEGKKRQSAGRRHKKGGKGRSVARLTWYLTGNIAAFSCFICFRFLSLTLSSFTLIFMLTARTLWKYPNPSPSLYFTTCQITTPLSLSLSLSLSRAFFSFSLPRFFLFQSFFFCSSKQIL